MLLLLWSYLHLVRFLLWWWALEYHGNSNEKAGYPTDYKHMHHTLESPVDRAWIPSVFIFYFSTRIDYRCGDIIEDKRSESIASQNDTRNQSTLFWEEKPRVMYRYHVVESLVNCECKRVHYKERCKAVHERSCKEEYDSKASSAENHLFRVPVSLDHYRSKRHNEDI